jgi:eukaryotic-like serine/threonine-protein kinase
LFEREMTAINGDPELLNERYRLEEPIGSGGMGRIYAAWDQDRQERVAVKLLDSMARLDEVAVERFRREAEVASHLQHPGIMRVLDWGEADGTPYLVMDYAEGPDLKRLLAERGRLDESEALEIVSDVARALGFAHRHGVVHRDVKPHNIVLASDGRARLTDFGIAQIAGAPQVTDTGTVVGSAHYLSPEQARGAPLDGRTDVYSLGVVLYELLTGRVPFEGDSLISIAMHQLQSEPVPPRQVVEELSPAAEAIVLRALAKDSAARFQTADEMADALDQLIGRTLVTSLADASTQVVITRRTAGALSGASPAPPSSAVPRGESPLRGRRAAVFAALVVFTVLVAGTLGWSMSRAGPILVPDLVGLSEAEAQASLEQLGLTLRVDGRNHSRGTPEGIVVGQEPGAGVETERGGTVAVGVSLGPEPVAAQGSQVRPPTPVAQPGPSAPAGSSGGSAVAPPPQPAARPAQAPAVSAPPADRDKKQDNGRGRDDDKRGNARGHDR